jgi:hypothetical protein
LQGSTMIQLAQAEPDVLAQALDLAWQNSALAAKPRKARKAASLR